MRGPKDSDGRPAANGPAPTSLTTIANDDTACERCSICQRALTAARSIRRGTGPICAARHSAPPSEFVRMRRPRAVYLAGCRRDRQDRLIAGGDAA